MVVIPKRSGEKAAGQGSSGRHLLGNVQAAASSPPLCQPRRGVCRGAAVQLSVALQQLVTEEVTPGLVRDLCPPEKAWLCFGVSPAQRALVRIGGKEFKVPEVKFLMAHPDDGGMPPHGCWEERRVVWVGLPPGLTRGRRAPSIRR